MLLEQLVEQDERPPMYDWNSYYRWYYSKLSGREVIDFKFWLCKKCLAVNVFLLPGRYGKCHVCKLIYLP